MFSESQHPSIPLVPAHHSFCFLICSYHFTSCAQHSVWLSCRSSVRGWRRKKEAQSPPRVCSVWALWLACFRNPSLIFAYFYFRVVVPHCISACPAWRSPREIFTRPGKGTTIFHDKFHREQCEKPVDYSIPLASVVPRFRQASLFSQCAMWKPLSPPLPPPPPSW